MICDYDFCFHFQNSQTVAQYDNSMNGDYCFAQCRCTEFIQSMKLHCHLYLSH